MLEKALYLLKQALDIQQPLKLTHSIIRLLPFDFLFVCTTTLTLPLARSVQKEYTANKNMLCQIYVQYLTIYIQQKFKLRLLPDNASIFQQYIL